MLSFIRRITRNWKLKTLAFALAVLLWVVISAEQVTNYWLGVPLEIQMTDLGHRVEPVDLPSQVEVRFSGTRGDLLDLALRKPALRLTIENVQNEVESRALDPRMVQIPAQLAVNALDVRPSSVNLRFTRIDQKLVPVRPLVSNDLGSDWAIVDTLAVDPAFVRVAGPVALLARIADIPTQPFELTPADTVIDRTIPLDTTRLRGLQFSDRSVRLTGRIDPVVDRTITGMSIDAGPGIQVLPDRVDVTLRGPASTVRAISPQSFRVAISIDEIPVRIPPGGMLVPLRTDRLRPGIQAQVNPTQVRLFTIIPPTTADTLPAPEAVAPDTVTVTEPPVQE